MPVQTVFDNLESGMSIDEITEVFDVTSEEVKAVLRFVSESLAKAPAYADEDRPANCAGGWQSAMAGCPLHLDRIAAAVVSRPVRLKNGALLKARNKRYSLPSTAYPPTTPDSRNIREPTPV